MPKSILLTSFTTWQPHQRSNSSDDLLEIISHQTPDSQPLHFLRHIPVDFDLAPAQLLAKVDALQPDIVLCCGMSESRSLLTVESNGKSGDEMITTPLDLATLTVDLPTTAISHDAGQFVCNWLYYSLLKHRAEQKLKSHCLFVHVPVLTPQNRELVASDFLVMMQRLLSL